MEPNPFEPEETREQQDARIGQMIRDNVDKKYAQSPDSTLSHECFYAETDTECSLCPKADCTHYCHTDSYKLWRATDTLVAFLLLMDIRSILHGKEDIAKQFPIAHKAAKDVSDIMTRIRNKNHGIINWEPNDELPTS